MEGLFEVRLLNSGLFIKGVEDDIMYCTDYLK